MYTYIHISTYIHQTQHTHTQHTNKKLKIEIAFMMMSSKPFAASVYLTFSISRCSYKVRKS